MKIALIGHGAMGRLVEVLAVERGHEIAVVIDDDAAAISVTGLAERLRGCDAAIDFTTAAAVRRNVESCMAASVPLVEGTTGWNAERDEIENLVRESGGTMVFGANFSVGVNLFYRMVDTASALMAKFPEYEVFIEEQHHSRKLDAPSGTALKVKDVVARHIQTEIPISSTRAGNIPGTHRVGFDGPADHIELTHTARSRDGFALGAITAAEWIIGKSGFFEFTDVMDEIIGK